MTYDEELRLLTLIVVGASFALYIGIAIWSKARTTGEFYVAGKSIHPIANGMATAADWMSAASFISMAGTHCFSRLRRFCVPDGLDGRIRTARPLARAIPAAIWKVYGARVYR